MSKISCFVVAVAGLMFLATGISHSSQKREFNWIREYVQLRVKAQTEEVFGGNRARSPDGAAQPRIVGGIVAPKSLHKFQVALLNPDIGNDYDAQFCGGSLVNYQYVITAAHCVDVLSNYEVAVLAGVRKLNEYGKGNRIGVSHIYLHPYWDEATLDYDVAILRLSKPVYGVPFAKLPPRNSDPAAGVTAAVTGWGTTAYEENSFPSKLLGVAVPVVDPYVCDSSYSYDGRITPRMFCAGSTGKDACQGDSGGPISLGPSFKTLVGVVSWGDGCGWSSFPGVYARLGYAGIHDWLTSILP